MSDTVNILTLQGEEEIEAEAAAWLTAMGRETISESERGEFNRWLKQSDRHQVAFNELSALWEDMAVLQDLKDIAESVITIPEPSQTLWQGRWFMSIAASLFIGIAVAGLFYLQHLNGLSQQDVFVTVVGEQRTLRLSDGSTLQLNTDSRIEVDFSRTKRAIRLIHGEAHFDVAKNKQRPFFVYAGDGVVRAVGTVFVVRLRLNNEVEVTVQEGRVALASLKTSEVPGSKAENLELGQPVAELTAGQSVVFGERVGQIAQIPSHELNRKLAWRQGMLVYAGDPLQDVIADVSRYADINIEITGTSLHAMPIAGYFRVGEVEALFDSLELTFGLNVERISENHVRLSAAL